MRSVSVTDLRRRSGEVFAAVDQEPLSITRRGTAEFVLISQAQFHEVLKRHAGHESEPRNAPRPQLALFEAALAKARKAAQDLPD